MPIQDERDLKQRLEDIRILTDQLLRTRSPSADAKRISERLRQEIQAAREIAGKRPTSDQ